MFREDLSLGEFILGVMAIFVASGILAFFVVESGILPDDMCDRAQQLLVDFSEKVL